MKLADFVVVQESERVAHERQSGLWFVDEGTLPTYTIEEVINGFEAHPDLTIRTQMIDEHGHKTILSREESLKQLK